jgi:hypothetical protein
VIDLSGNYQQMELSTASGASTTLVRPEGSTGEWFDKKTGEPFGGFKVNKERYREMTGKDWDDSLIDGMK